MLHWLLLRLIRCTTTTEAAAPAHTVQRTIPNQSSDANATVLIERKTIERTSIYGSFILASRKQNIIVFVLLLDCLVQFRWLWVRNRAGLRGKGGGEARTAQYVLQHSSSIPDTRQAAKAKLASEASNNQNQPHAPENDSSDVATKQIDSRSSSTAMFDLQTSRLFRCR